MDKLEELYEICETLSRDLAETNDKFRKAGGKMTVGDLDYVDKLTHAIKSVKTTIAMMEAEEDGGHSGRMYPSGYSYAGRYNARRDSRGRHSRDGGYSYADSLDGVMDEMRGMMGSMPEEKRREVERFLDKMERM